MTGFVVIVLENNNKDVTFGSPYFLNLTTQGMVLSNYQGEYSSSSRLWMDWTSL